MKAKEFKKIFFYSKSAWLYLVLFLVFVANLVYSAYLHRPMYHEGSEWYFKILQFRKYYADNQHFRYFDILIQLPAYFVQRFLDPGTPHAAIAMLDVGYTFHPLTSLLLCIFLLQKYNRMELVIFPVVSFFALSVPASLFAVSNGAQILTVFWPLLILLLLPDRPTIWNALAVLTLILFLTFVHEFTMFLIPLLFLTAWQKRTLNKIYYFYCLLFVISLISQFYFLTDAIQHRRFGSLMADIRAFNLFHGVTLLVFILFFSLILSSLRSYKISVIYKLSLLIGAIVATYTLFFINPPYFYSSRLSRSFTAPCGALLALLVLLIETKHIERWRKLLYTKVTVLPIFFAVTSIVILYTSTDIRNTQIWKSETAEFKRLLLNRKGCHVLKQRESNGYLGFYAGMPFFSILFQETRDIEVILMQGFDPADKRQPKGPFFCGVGSHKYFFSNERAPIYIEDGLYFNFQKVFDSGYTYRD